MVYLFCSSCYVTVSALFSLPLGAVLVCGICSSNLLVILACFLVLLFRYYSDYIFSSWDNKSPSCLYMYGFLRSWLPGPEVIKLEYNLKLKINRLSVFLGLYLAP